MSDVALNMAQASAASGESGAVAVVTQAGGAGAKGAGGVSIPLYKGPNLTVGAGASTTFYKNTRNHPTRSPTVMCTHTIFFLYLVPGSCPP